MADPLTMVSLGTTVVGGGLSALGAINKGEAEEQMSSYKAMVAQQNAQIALQNSAYEVNKGAFDAFNNDLRSRQQLGTGRAAAGASGFDIGSGSTQSALESVHTIDRYNTLSIVSDAQRKGYNQALRARDYLTQSSMDTAAGENAQSAASINAASSLLGTASSVSDKWSRYKAQGIFG